MIDTMRKEYIWRYEGQIIARFEYQRLANTGKCWIFLQTQYRDGTVHKREMSYFTPFGLMDLARISSDPFTDWGKYDTMTFEKACQSCHVRSAIYRAAKPEDMYWKNHQTPLDERVSESDQSCVDWIEYDPREDPASPRFNEMPA